MMAKREVVIEVACGFKLDRAVLDSFDREAQYSSQ
jgi:hypothetical protein